MDYDKIDYEALKELLKARLTPQRYFHSLCVMEEAVILADLYGADREKARLAGLLHDITKNMPDEEQLSLMDTNGVPLTELERSSRKLYHAMSGAWVVEHELNIDDRDIINAIRYHTTARGNMSLLEKVIYMADYVSADRDYDGADELRELAHRDFTQAMLVAVAYTVTELVEKKAQIHPDTVEAWNNEVKQLKPQERKS